jgi:hypothetical protein
MSRLGPKSPSRSSRNGVSDQNRDGTIDSRCSQLSAAALGEKPTVRAIQEHVFKLKKEAAATGGTAGATPKRNKTTSLPVRATACTPTKRSAPKSAPTTSSKRQKKKLDSESDEEENDSVPITTPARPQARPRRAASEKLKEVLKTLYASDEDEENEDDTDEDAGDDDGTYGEENQNDEEARESETVEESAVMKGKDDAIPDAEDIGADEAGRLLDEAETLAEQERAVKLEPGLLDEA